VLWFDAEHAGTDANGRAPPTFSAAGEAGAQRVDRGFAWAGPPDVWASDSGCPAHLCTCDCKQPPTNDLSLTQLHLDCGCCAVTDETLGFGQPCTAVKVRPPGSWIRSRPYSVCSSPLRSGSFQLLVKLYPGGRVSGHLGTLQVGQFAWFAKTRTKPMAEGVRRAGLIACVYPRATATPQWCLLRTGDLCFHAGECFCIFRVIIVQIVCAAAQIRRGNFRLHPHCEGTS
jgi:hypothetical protein